MNSKNSKNGRTTHLVNHLETGAIDTEMEKEQPVPVIVTVEEEVEKDEVDMTSEIRKAPVTTVVKIGLDRLSKDLLTRLKTVKKKPPTKPPSSRERWIVGRTIPPQTRGRSAAVSSSSSSRSSSSASNSSRNSSFSSTSSSIHWVSDNEANEEDHLDKDQDVQVEDQDENSLSEIGSLRMCLTDVEDVDNAAAVIPGVVHVEDHADDDEVFVSPLQVPRPKDVQHSHHRPNNDSTILNTPSVYTSQKTPTLCPDWVLCPPGSCKGNAKKISCTAITGQHCPELINDDELSTMINAAETSLNSSISPTRATPFHTPPPSVTFSSSMATPEEHALVIVVDQEIMHEANTKQPLQPPDLFKDHHHETLEMSSSISAALSFGTTTEHDPTEMKLLASSTRTSSSSAVNNSIQCTKDKVIASIEDKSDDLSDCSAWSEDEGDKSDWSETKAWSDDDDDEAKAVTKDPDDSSDDDDDDVEIVTDANSRPSFTRLFKEARRSHLPERNQVLADLYRLDMENDDQHRLD